MQPQWKELANAVLSAVSVAAVAALSQWLRDRVPNAKRSSRRRARRISRSRQDVADRSDDCDPSPLRVATAPRPSWCLPADQLAAQVLTDAEAEAWAAYVAAHFHS